MLSPPVLFWHSFRITKAPSLLTCNRSFTIHFPCCLVAEAVIIYVTISETEVFCHRIKQQVNINNKNIGKIKEMDFLLVVLDTIIMKCYLCPLRLQSLSPTPVARTK